MLVLFLFWIYLLLLSHEWIRDNVLIVFLQIFLLIGLSCSLHRLSLVFAKAVVVLLEIEVLLGLHLPLVLTLLSSERPKVLCLAQTQKLSMLHLLDVLISLACSLLLVHLSRLVISYGLCWIVLAIELLHNLELHLLLLKLLIAIAMIHLQIWIHLYIHLVKFKFRKQL